MLRELGRQLKLIGGAAPWAALILLLCLGAFSYRAKSPIEAGPAQVRAKPPKISGSAPRPGLGLNESRRDRMRRDLLARTTRLPRPDLCKVRPGQFWDFVSEGNIHSVWRVSEIGDGWVRCVYLRGRFDPATRSVIAVEQDERWGDKQVPILVRGDEVWSAALMRSTEMSLQNLKPEVRRYGLVELASVDCSRPGELRRIAVAKGFVTFPGVVEERGRSGRLRRRLTAVFGPFDEVPGRALLCRCGRRLREGTSAVEIGRPISCPDCGARVTLDYPSRQSWRPPLDRRGLSLGRRYLQVLDGAGGAYEVWTLSAIRGQDLCFSRQAKGRRPLRLVTPYCRCGKRLLTELALGDEGRRLRCPGCGLKAHLEKVLARLKD